MVLTENLWWLYLVLGHTSRRLVGIGVYDIVDHKSRSWKPCAINCGQARNTTRPAVFPSRGILSFQPTQCIIASSYVWDNLSYPFHVVLPLTSQLFSPHRGLFSLSPQLQLLTAYSLFISRPFLVHLHLAFNSPTSHNVATTLWRFVLAGTAW